MKIKEIEKCYALSDAKNQGYILVLGYFFASQPPISAIKTSLRLFLNTLPPLLSVIYLQTARLKNKSDK